MTGAQFIADFLERSDVTHVFWVPAVLMQTLREMEGKNRIQGILAHSEKAAVYMADGYARASRRPGVCFAQKIGASNLAAGLRDPHLACTPIITITGTSTPNTQHRHTYQQIDDTPAFLCGNKCLTRASMHWTDCPICYDRLFGRPPHRPRGPYISRSKAIWRRSSTKAAISTCEWKSVTNTCPRFVQWPNLRPS